MTCLEDLSNELFHELLDYFSIDELYQSFYGLNLRLTNLLKLYSCGYLKLESKINLDMIGIFAKNIKSLRIQKAHNLISLTRFADSLVVLILDELTGKYLKELPLLIHLKHLQIKSIIDERLEDEFKNYLVSSTQLHYLSLAFGLSDTKNFIFSSLNSVRLCERAHNNEINSLIHCMPNLVYAYLYDSYIKEFPSIGDKPPNVSHNITKFHLHLRNGFTYSQLDYYLAHMSNITLFYFSTSPCRVYRNQTGPYAILNEIANMVQKRLLNLEKFICYATFEIRSNDTFDINRIHRIYHQHYSIKIGQTSQKFKSIWSANLN